MRTLLFTLSVLVLSSCTALPPRSVSTEKPTALSTQDLISTVVASGPMAEVTFDGTACSLTDPGNLHAGNLVTKFTNTTGQIATPWLGRLYPDKTWQELLDWIGQPGTVFHKETPPWFALIQYDRNVSESPSVGYRQYNLKIEADYVIFVEFPSDYWWPCGSFHVTSSS